MCIGSKPTGPQKWREPSDDNDNDDSAGNAFGSLEYHKKIRDDADKRRTTGSREAAEGRKGQKSLLGSIKGMF